MKNTYYSNHLGSFFILFFVSVFSGSVFSAYVPAVSYGSDELSWQTRNAKSSVREIVSSSSGGTGFFIDADMYITDLHVIAPMVQTGDMGDMAVIREGGPAIEVKEVVFVSVLYDLALVQTKKFSNYLTVGEIPPKPDESLFVSGYPGEAFTEMKKIGGNIFMGDHFYAFPVDRSFPLYGASGSPILDKWGQVVGVVSSETGGVLFAANLNYLRKFISGEVGSSCADFASVTECIKREIETLRKKAKKGSPLAQHTLASLLYNGEIVEEDKKEAFKWWLKAAKKGFAPAQYSIGNMYHKGEPGVVEKNLRKTLRYWTLAAHQGFPLAQGNLALFSEQNKEATEESIMSRIFKRGQQSSRRLGIFSSHSQRGYLEARHTSTPQEECQTAWGY